MIGTTVTSVRTACNHLNARVISHGLTGSQGSYHTEQAQTYGTQMVGGVMPGKGGQSHFGLPDFKSFQKEMGATKVNASGIYALPPFVADDFRDRAQRMATAAKE